MLKYFEYAHLREDLQEASRPFYELARRIDQMSAHDPREKQVALRKLLEAKDAYVRSQLSH